MLFATEGPEANLRGSSAGVERRESLYDGGRGGSAETLGSFFAVMGAPEAEVEVEREAED